MRFDEATLATIREGNPIADVLTERGVPLRGQGKEQRAQRCPAREHSRPDAVSVNVESGQWHCHVCNNGGDVIAWLQQADSLSFPQAVETLAARAGVELNGKGDRNAPLSRPASPPVSAASAATTKTPAETETPGKRRVVVRYDYTSETGALLFQVERTDPKGFRQRRPDGNGGWLYNLDGVRRVLYRLPEVVKATGEIWIAEGERDCDTLTGLGFTATTNSGGAGKWRDEYNDALRGKSVVIVPDNDAPGLKHGDAVARSLHGVAASVRVVRLPDTVKDCTDFVATFTDKADAAERLALLAEGAAEYQPDAVAKPVAPVLEFLRPSELLGYRPPEGIVLAGDCHVVRGSVFVIGGAPGVGKSRAGVALGVAGATGADWFNLKVHARFRTMIVQNENGRFRLQREFADLDCPALEDFVRVCPPPPLGLAFDKVEFQAALTAAIADFRPDVILIDPWNAVARDEKARDYLDTFNVIRSVIPTGDNAPALGIVAHTRKPKNDERATGRGLLNLLAGSYVLGSVPRTAFVLQSASDDPTDARVVWTCCKNNDGELGERTAWQRRNGLFAPVADFDWTEFDRPASDRPTVTEADVADVFQHGQRSVRKAEAVADLQERTGAGKSACYNALKLDGRFAGHLAENEGLLTWTP